MLLSDIRDIIKERPHSDRISSSELAATLGEMEGRPWAECGRARKPMTATALARQLEGFDAMAVAGLFGSVADNLAAALKWYSPGCLDAECSITAPWRVKARRCSYRFSAMDFSSGERRAMSLRIYPSNFSSSMSRGSIP